LALAFRLIISLLLVEVVVVDWLVAAAALVDTEHLPGLLVVEHLLSPNLPWPLTLRTRLQ
jgi:hypothetical protein